MGRKISERVQINEKKVKENLYRHVEILSAKIGERHLWKENSLKQAEEYIDSELNSYGYEVWHQTYSCYGQKVSNLSVEKSGTEKGGLLVIGAHYDTVPGTPGADDNASAVAGLLELARLFQMTHSSKTLRFVAFVNEEPPCFGFSNMGSMVYASYLKEQKALVEVMISLEMIGYFRDEPIQRFPLPGMELFYPKTGNFIGVVGDIPSHRYVRLIKNGIRRHSRMDARSLTAPHFFGGINLSDNYSFWRHGYRAVMVTDTSFFRNPNYHQETDTIDTLHFERMTELIKGLFYTLLTI